MSLIETIHQRREGVKNTYYLRTCCKTPKIGEKSLKTPQKYWGVDPRFVFRQKESFLRVP